MGGEGGGELKFSRYLQKAMEHPDEVQNLESLLAAKSEKFRNLLIQYMQTNRICHGATVDFVLENIITSAALRYCRLK